MFAPALLPQGLCTVLDAATRDGDAMLEPQLDYILQNLYPLLQFPPSFNDQPAVRNYNELLRCFEKLCRPFSDRLIAFMFIKLENREEMSRVGALLVLKHLINSCDGYLADKKERIVAGLKPLLEDGSLRVQQTLAQVIIAMAHHDYLRLEGGESLVRYIVMLCSVTANEAPTADDKKKRRSKGPDDEVTPLALRSMCDNILYMATKTVPCMELVLWPYLLEFVVPRQFTEALPTLCQCLSFLADKLSEEENDSYDIDFDVEVNLPKPQQILARFIVILGHPLYRQRGAKILALLQAISVNIHEDIEELWDDVVPKLLGYLEKNSDDWKQAAWEDLVLKFLSRTLDTINEEEWILAVGEALGEQYSLYSNEPELKNMVSKCLGVVLRKSTKKEFLEQQLDVLFMSVDHNSQTEREGCAKGYGFCASSHLDLVIEALQNLTRREMVRKSTGFLGMMKDKSEIEVARIKATIMLTYGFVTFYAPPSLITSRIEVNILASINPHFGNVRDVAVKQNLIRCVELIGKSLHPDHLKVGSFVLHRRGELLSHMQAYMRAEPLVAFSTETRALCIDACTTLVKLEPKLSDADLYELVEVASNCVLETAQPSEGDVTNARLCDQARQSLNDLLAVVITKDATAACLQNLFSHFSRWIVSPREHQRRWVMNTYAAVLDAFRAAAKAICESGEDRGSVDGLGKFLADLVPRCTDPVPEVRADALRGIQTLLNVQHMYNGKGEDEDVMIEVGGSGRVWDRGKSASLLGLSLWDLLGGRGGSYAFPQG